MLPESANTTLRAIRLCISGVFLLGILSLTCCTIFPFREIRYQAVYEVQVREKDSHQPVTDAQIRYQWKRGNNSRKLLTDESGRSRFEWEWVTRLQLQGLVGQPSTPSPTPLECTITIQKEGFEMVTYILTQDRFVYDDHEYWLTEAVALTKVEHKK